MMHLLLFCSAMALAILGNVPTVTSSVPSDCLNCICKAESGCRIPNPVCRKDGSSPSCGPYQIKSAYWQDAGSPEGDWKNCTATFSCSETAVQGYMGRYAIKRLLGHTPTCQDFARIHNGGPSGFKRSYTLGYWGKVKACLGHD